MSIKKTLLKACGGAAPMEAQYNGYQANAGSGTSYTFSSVPFGDAADDRIVVVGLSYRIGGSSQVTSCTIGGVTATIATAACSTAGVALCYANVPSGTSGTVYFGGLSAGADSAFMGSWSIYNASETTPYAASSAVSASRTLNIPEGGCQICIAGNTGASAVTWTNATEQHDIYVDSVLRGQTTFDSDMSAQTSRSISYSGYSGTPALACLSWI